MKITGLGAGALGGYYGGWLRDRAAALAIDAPILRMAAANIEVYEAQRAARRA